MSLWVIALAVGALFFVAYSWYGRFLSAKLDLRDDRVTPAVRINDGVDHIPTRRAFLLGQHFSAIAAAGPIVGPILGALWFGWLPTLIWLVVGAIFFGAVHDFSSLVASIRHGAVSVVDIAREQLGRRAYLILLVFVWFSLLYVITAFTDLTSASFVDPELGGGVASSSLMYLGIGVVMGVAMRKFRMPLGWATLVFLPMVVLAVWFGRMVPVVLPAVPFLSQQQTWNVLLLGYCFVASVIPVWILLQPRGYLGGFFLYVTLAFGLIGLFLGGEKVLYPAFIGFTNSKGMPLFPILFVTVACGACSGFHGIVCSGTTSKQIKRESDCRAVGYGGMLLEGLVALVALSTVMILAPGDPLVGASPDRVYAEGLGRFVQNFGIPRDFARAFTLLAFTTFIYDTLDVATRLARYILQELTGWKSEAGRLLATAASLAIPLVCVSIRMHDAAGNAVPAWKVFWTIFGTSNQLLAALTLMVLSFWLARSGKPWWFSAVPMAFMFGVTVWSLALMLKPDATGVVSLLLLILAVALVVEALRHLHRPAATEKEKV